MKTGKPRVSTPKTPHKPAQHRGEAHKRSFNQRKNDLVLIAKLTLMGKTQQEIVEHLAANRPYRVSRPQISYDMAEVRKEWMKDSVSALDQKKAMELARISTVEAEAWSAWEKSKRDKVRKVSGKVVTTGAAKDGTAKEQSVESAQVIEEGSTGDPRYMEVILRCAQQRARILGLEAPTRLANADGGKIEPVAVTSVVCYLPDNGRATDSPDPIQPKA